MKLSGLSIHDFPMGRARTVDACDWRYTLFQRACFVTGMPGMY